MPNGSRRRKRSSQNGVQAIFTRASNFRGNLEIAVGGVVVGLGVFFWAFSLRYVSDSVNLEFFPDTPSISALFQPLAIIFITGGIGLCSYSLAVQRARQDNYRIEAAVYELQTLVEAKTGPPSPSPEATSSGKTSITRGHRFHLSKAFAAVLVEGVLLLLAYSGLVQEYNSNLNMQGWVHANFAVAGYLLSYNTVLFLVAGLVGYLIFQLATRFSPRLGSK